MVVAGERSVQGVEAAVKERTLEAFWGLVSVLLVLEMMAARKRTLKDLCKVLGVLSRL